jgi:Asp-tRNA(Asn)/Glu-tRNA(Gln) amidotransferase A subunit family amidase
MRSHTNDIVKRLRQAGAEVQEVEFPGDFSEIVDNGRNIMAVEAATYHQAMFAKHKDLYRARISKLIEQGLSISATEYAEMLETRLHQYASVKPLLHQVDALLTPGAVGAAPHGLASTGSPAMQGPWTIMGVPSISLPTGLNKDGLPLAIQLVGRPKAEDYLLTTARWCERVLNMRLRPPPYQC